jgi:hypothetical protein
MRILATAALLGIAFVAAPASQTAQNPRLSDSLERPFPANGQIRMDLSAGEYHITGSMENRVRLQWRVRDPEELSQVRARADVRGREASIMTDGPDHFKVDIEVPARADLYIRLTAGELSVDKVEGNKDIGLHAGEIDIDVVRPEDYHSVSASVWAGEVHAAPYHLSKEGLFRSVDWTGKGPYRLEARLKAGEVRLHTNPR